MDELSITYRAIKEYRDLTDKVPEIKNFITEMHGNSNVLEKLESLTTICKIDNDWVEAIQKAMPFISNAVMENRQFVRSDGEVLPIEKIRSVGKDTIADLAKHSNYITRGPDENGKLIPDKLMMPQKDNDYAVYENRFLYSLLIYLSQFIEIRLNEIMAITGKYQATTKLVKKENTTTRHLEFELTFADTRFNDPFVSKNNGSSDAVDIIKSCLNDTKSLLMTPLMKEVSKAPMVHPPITKTNVFKFDHNFKESLALYEFLQSYTKKGYSEENVSVKMSPFQVKMAEQFSELVYLTSYLTYIYGNNLNPRLKKIYDDEERQRKIDEENKILAEIKRVSKNIKESGMTPEEYVLLLQKGHKILEKKLLDKDQEILDVKNSVAERIKEITLEFNKRYEETKDAFNKKYLEDKAVLEADKKKMADDIAAERKRMSDALEAEVKRCNEEIERKANELAVENLNKTQQYIEQILELQKKIKELQDNQQSVVDSCNEEKRKMAAECNEKITANETKTAELQALAIEKTNEAEATIKKFTDENQLLRGRVTALLAITRKNPNKDYTQKEEFKELEKERAAFEKLFGESWKKTKKRIRDENLKITAAQIKAEQEALKAEKEKERQLKEQEKAQQKAMKEQAKANKKAGKPEPKPVETPKVEPKKEELPKEEPIVEQKPVEVEKPEENKNEEQNKE